MMMMLLHDWFHAMMWRPPPFLLCVVSLNQPSVPVCALHGFSFSMPDEPDEDDEWNSSDFAEEEEDESDFEEEESDVDAGDAWENLHAEAAECTSLRNGHPRCRTPE